MLSFANSTTYVLTCINAVGAFVTAVVMYWASFNSIRPLRKIYGALCVLAASFFAAHILLLFDIDDPAWTGYVQVLRAISWPILCLVPIVARRWVKEQSALFVSLAKKIEGD